MKKIRKLITLCVLLALLVAAYAIISGLNTDVDDPDDSVPDESDPMYDVASINVETLSEIVYTYEGKEYSFSLNADKTRWIWSENEALILDNAYFSAMAKAFSSITSTVRIERVPYKDLAKYGLDEPRTVISLKDGKNGEQTFRFGALNSFNGQYYFTNDFTHRSLPCTVYMADESILDHFQFTPDDMLKHDVLPTVGKDKLIEILVEDTDGCCATTISYYKNGKPTQDSTDKTEPEMYVSAHGEEAMLDPEITSAITEGLGNMYFDDFITYDKSALAEYGLDRPVRILINYYVTRSVTDESTGQTSTVDVEDTLVLLVGNADENKIRYGMLEGSPYVYKLSSAIFDTLAGYAH